MYLIIAHFYLPNDALRSSGFFIDFSRSTVMLFARLSVVIMCGLAQPHFLHIPIINSTHLLLSSHILPTSVLINLQMSLREITHATSFLENQVEWRWQCFWWEMGIYHDLFPGLYPQGRTHIQLHALA